MYSHCRALFWISLTAVLFWPPLFATAGAAPAAPISSRAAQVQRFRGAWFEVAVPAGFGVRPSLKSATAEGYDSAEFTAPDGSVAFYVYSPQWGGEPTDIALDPARETVVADQREEVKGRTVRFYTIADQRKKYFRAYRETIEQAGAIRWVTGIRYKNAAAKKRFDPAYRRFVESLRQFADGE